MDPRMWAWLLQHMMNQYPAPTANSPLDLTAIRDLMGKKKIIDGEGEDHPEPLPVAVTNLPIAYPG